MDKNFIKGLFGKVFQFQNGGEVINISGKTEEVIESLKAITNEAGYFNITASKQKADPSKVSFWEDTFQKDQKANESTTTGATSGGSDGLPF